MTGRYRAVIVKTRGPDETRAVGAAIGRSLAPGMAVSLEGPLGSGKTVLAQGICTGLGVEDPVTSPTYTLRHDHVGRDERPVIHLDCFRLAGAAELEELAIDECLDEGAVLLVEWGERALAALPLATIRIRLETTNGSERQLVLHLPPGVELQVGAEGEEGLESEAAG
jgi:tRNA threonylcarbamoyladenosine biosynthesis protein TsaE